MSERAVSYSVTIENGYGLVTTHQANDFRSLAMLVQDMIEALPTHDERVKTRMLLKRWMAHPEIGQRLSLAIGGYVAPPPSTGRCAANLEPKLCVVCNRSRAQHDIDGQRSDCDGYVAS